jgi:hypothetical protein
VAPLRSKDNGGKVLLDLDAGLETNHAINRLLRRGQQSSGRAAPAGGQEGDFYRLREKS